MQKQQKNNILKDTFRGVFFILNKMFTFLLLNVFNKCGIINLVIWF